MSPRKCRNSNSNSCRKNENKQHTSLAKHSQRKRMTAKGGKGGKGGRGKSDGTKSSTKSAKVCEMFHHLKQFFNYYHFLLYIPHLSAYLGWITIPSWSYRSFLKEGKIC